MRRVNLIPMAGLGKRFINKGYKVPKPLILVDGKPMFVKAARSLPKADHYIFICLKTHVKRFQINKKIKLFFPNSEIIILNKKTTGQAASCLKAKNKLKNNDIVTIGSCDNSMDYNKNLLEKKIKNSDLIIWTFKDKSVVSKNPEMYGYVKTDRSDNAIKVSCKKKISNKPEKDHAIIGAFTFKKAKTLITYTKKLIKKNYRINSEFYLDSVADICVKSGLKVKVNLVKKYHGWDTPSDLKRYLKKNNYE